MEFLEISPFQIIWRKHLVTDSELHSLGITDEDKRLIGQIDIAKNGDENGDQTTCKSFDAICLTIIGHHNRFSIYILP